MHSWEMSVRDAVTLQKELSGRVVASGRPEAPDLVAGVDIAVSKQDSMGFCGVLVFRYSTLSLVEERYASGPLVFPYVPGLLSFREGPLFLQAYAKLETKPHVILFDGQGIAHPRRFGIASHMGVYLGVPTIGCAKSRLYGEYREPGRERGSWSMINAPDGSRIGAALRTRTNVKPVFVSPGHMVGLEEAVAIVMHCTGAFRVPVPTRMAHIRTGEYRDREPGRTPR